MMSARLKQDIQTARGLVHDVSTTKTRHRLPEAWSMMSARLKQDTDCQTLGP